jgi:hypothetical protein
VQCELALRVTGIITIIITIIVAIAVAVAILRIPEGHISETVFVWVVDSSQSIEEKTTLDFFCKVSLIVSVQER